MVNANLGGQYDLAQRIARLERNARNLSTTPLLDNATVGPGGVLNVVGSVAVTDPATGVQTYLGTVPDGVPGVALQNQIASNATDVATATQTAEDAAANALLANNTINDQVFPAINDAAASPVTDSRLAAGSLTVWPFKSSTVPAGALVPGSIGSVDIGDFSIDVTKLNDTRHHLY